MRAGVLVSGALGKMGERVRAALAEQPSLELAAAVEGPGHAGIGSEVAPGIAVTDDLKAALTRSTVAIDFTVPVATLSLLRGAADAGVAAVVGTTGFSGEERAEIEQLATRIPLVLAPNFSVSVNVLMHLVEKASGLLPEFDAEIVELHHSAKRDAPSGTALGLAEAIARGRKQTAKDHLVVSREGETGPRPEGAIGIQTLRGGDNPGEHTVHLISQGERLELAHRAYTRDHFAQGAVRAAAWLLENKKPAALYTMRDVLDLS